MFLNGGLTVPHTVVDPFLHADELLNVSVLVDSGAASSFVSEALVRRLGLVPTPHTKPVTVHYADGRTSHSPGTVSLPMVIQGRTVTEPDGHYRPYHYR
eukprot:9302374-Karenia_brevis.AAC.1